MQMPYSIGTKGPGGFYFVGDPTTAGIARRVFIGIHLYI
jgi:hypothetical protein